MTKVTRTVDISHLFDGIIWEEKYALSHAGAQLEDPFSRTSDLDLHDSLTFSLTPSFQQLSALLPVGATNVYYRYDC